MTQRKTVTFEDQDQKGEEVELEPGPETLSGESGVEENVQSEEQDLEGKILSGEFRWMSRAHKTDSEEEAYSVTDSSVVENSRNSGIDTYSDTNSSTGSELSELAIHTFLDREVFQDPDSDRYLIRSKTVFDNAADDLERIDVSKRWINLLPQKEVVRTDLEPFRQRQNHWRKFGE